MSRGVRFDGPWTVVRTTAAALFVVQLLLFVAPSQCNWLKNFAKAKPHVRLMEGVTEHLHNVMPYEQVQFSNPNVSTAYVSSTKFQAAGMGHLYSVTNKFIQYILSDQAFPEGFVDVEDGNTIQVDYLSQQWPTLVSHYWASASVLVAGLVFAVLMPLIGLTLCCCRCAGGCGSRSQPFDAKYDSCKRQFYGIILAGFTILISFGVVCAFVSNEYLEDGVKELPSNVKKSLNDTRLYINNTKTEVDNLLVVNFEELEETLSNILEASGEIVKKKLGEVSKASVLANLTAVVNGLGLIKQDLSNVDLLTRQLQETALQLDTALKECRTIIMKKLEACRYERACRDILNRFNIQDLSLEANFSQLPNVSASLKNISDLITTDIEEEVMKGQQQFEKVKTMIQNAVNDNIPEIKQNIRKVGNAIKENCVKVDKVLDRVDTTIANSYSPMQRGEGLLKEFSPYRYYVCLGVAITLFFILLCLTLGLFCGFCGSRPEGGYHDDCCNKGTGASYLMMAVWLMFSSSAFLMMMALFYFVTGVTTDRIICEPLQNPTPSRVLNIVNRLYDVSAIHKLENQHPPYAKQRAENTDFNISSIIRDCHQNMSLFQVLKMERLIDLNKVLEYPTYFGIDEHINTFVSKIKLEGDIIILTPEAEKQLMKLAKSPLSSIYFPAYTHLLGEKITSIDLIQLADALNQTAAQLPSSKAEIKFSLTNQAMYLKVHQGQHVAAMLDISQRLENTANQLQEHLRFNHTSLRHAVEHLLIEVEQAQRYLHTEGPTIVTTLAKEFGDEFNKHIDQYLQRVVSQVREDVGKCWPMSQAYNATIVAGCKKILNPYNGFWMSVGICSILFMPIIILCVKLASLYQKSDPYPGPLVEAEYLYDAYADRENIPLASSNHKKKNVRNKPRKKVTTTPPGGNRSSNIPVGYENMSNPEVTGNTSANESRHPGHGGSVDYSAHLGRANIVVPTTSPSGALPEATPKPTWDFPNGGPPHYQNPISSEYERPPPYYYPGPSGPPGAPPESQSS